MDLLNLYSIHKVATKKRNKEQTGEFILSFLKKGRFDLPTIDPAPTKSLKLWNTDLIFTVRIAKHRGRSYRRRVPRTYMSQPYETERRRT